MTPLTALEAYHALAWHAELGVDCCVEAVPQKVEARGQGSEGRGQRAGVREERNALGVSAAAPGPWPLASGPSPVASGLSSAIADARALADAAADLAALEAAVRGFDGCALKKTATHTVFAQGVATSRVMFIGEAPGADEDRQGVPFCGESGQLLDKMLGFIGLHRAENFYITNTLFWRPPGNRQPTPEELAICQPFVEKHITLVNPKLLVLVGGTATKAVLGEDRGITRLRGQKFTYKNDYLAQEIPVRVIYHPSYLLRQPLAKKQTWADLLAIRDALLSS